MKRILQILLLLLLVVAPQLQAQNKELPLNPGDQIGIQISGIPPEEVPQISHLYRISEQGSISLLYLNEVRAAGMKPSELERKIESLYIKGDIYTHPTISISIDSGVGTERVIYVSGAVTKPGPVQYRQGMTVAKAVSSAGGKTPFGRLNKVKLVRGGKPVGVLNLEKAGSADGDIPLQPEDEIVVPD